MRSEAYARDIFPTVFNPDHRAWTLSGFAAQRMTGARHLYAKIMDLPDDELAVAKGLVAREFVSKFTSLYGAIEIGAVDDWASTLNGMSGLDQLLDVLGTEGIVPPNPLIGTLRTDLMTFYRGWQAARNRYDK